jgi:hypothetical protein
MTEGPTAIGAHPNHDAIATAKIICRPPGANSPMYGILARHSQDMKPIIQNTILTFPDVSIP